MQGKDGIGNGLGNGLGGRRGIFGWEGRIDTHYLHIVYTMHALYTFPFLTRLSPGRDNALYESLSFPLIASSAAPFT